MSSISHSVLYAGPSALALESGRATLALATPEGGPSSALLPDFVRGRLHAPVPFAQGLLAVGHAARSRFHTPPAMRERLVRESDPVITADASHLRFESFSACCGVYARLDVPLDALDGDVFHRGTTNVDLGPELRTSLSRVRAALPLDLFVGPERFGVVSGGERTLERKVPLPTRWIRGFLEVQSILPALEHQHTMRGTASVRFLQGLPRKRTKGGLAMAPAPTGLRVTRPGAPRSFQVGAPDRLKLLGGVAPSMVSLAVHAEPAKGASAAASAWVAELKGGLRLTLLLSSEVWRGLSGEGRALESLRGSSIHLDEATTRLRGALHWQGTLDRQALARSQGLSHEEVDAALTRLGALGLVGYDLVEARHFHRVLPYDLSLIESLQPRLEDARALFEGGSCTVKPEDEGDGLLILVASRSRTYHVRLHADGATCTCTWFARHGGERGPCKHVIAAELATEGGSSDGR